MRVIITGTSRGIGLELTRVALDKGHEVLAVARHPEKSDGLQELRKKSEKLSLLALDLDTENAELRLVDAIEKWPAVDVLINNAGIYEEDHRRENFLHSFKTNSVVPLFVTKALLPKLKASQRPLSLQITSQMGSIADNASGGSYAYRASKAALNMLFKSLSVDEPWLISLLVHPGWVKTDMGGSGAPMSASDSAAAIWQLAETANLKQNGAFLNYRGEKLPW